MASWLWIQKARLQPPVQYWYSAGGLLCVIIEMFCFICFFFRVWDKPNMAEKSCETFLKSGVSVWMTMLIEVSHRDASCTQPPGLLGRDRLHPKVCVCARVCVRVLVVVSMRERVCSHPLWVEIRGSPGGTCSTEGSGRKWLVPQAQTTHYLNPVKTAITMKVTWELSRTLVDTTCRCVPACQSYIWKCSQNKVYTERETHTPPGVQLDDFTSVWWLAFKLHPSL